MRTSDQNDWLNGSDNEIVIRARKTRLAAPSKPWILQRKPLTVAPIQLLLPVALIQSAISRRVLGMPTKSDTVRSVVRILFQVAGSVLGLHNICHNAMVFQLKRRVVRVPFSIAASKWAHPDGIRWLIARRL